MSRRARRAVVYVFLVAVAAWGLYTTRENQADISNQVDTNRHFLHSLRDAADDNHTLACRIGGFLVGTPIVKQPEMTQAQFVKVVGKAEGFLTALREFHCGGLGGVTTDEIKAQLHALHEAAPDASPTPDLVRPMGGGGASSSGSSPPSSPPGGGHDGGTPSPPDNPPPVTTTSTTTTTRPLPPPPPPPGGKDICVPRLDKCIHVPPLGALLAVAGL